MCHTHALTYNATIETCPAGPLAAAGPQARGDERGVCDYLEAELQAGVAAAGGPWRRGAQSGPRRRAATRTAQCAK